MKSHTNCTKKHHISCSSILMWNFHLKFESIATSLFKWEAVNVWELAYQEIYCRKLFVHCINVNTIHSHQCDFEIAAIIKFTKRANKNKTFVESKSYNRTTEQILFSFEWKSVLNPWYTMGSLYIDLLLCKLEWKNKKNELEHWK